MSTFGFETPYPNQKVVNLDEYIKKTAFNFTPNLKIVHWDSKNTQITPKLCQLKLKVIYIYSTYLYIYSTLGPETPKNNPKSCPRLNVGIEGCIEGKICPTIQTNPKNFFKTLPQPKNKLIGVPKGPQN